MSDALTDSIVSLGFDLWSMKLYLVATSALWVFDYLLTLDAEITFAWKGKKTPVFWMFILNRYLPLVVLILTLVGYFDDAFNLAVCARYMFMETFQTMLLTFTAEVFLTLRVYALLGCNRLVPIVSSIIIAWQWAIAIFAMSQSPKGTDQSALLLSRSFVPDLPTLPSTDAYHVCSYIFIPTVAPWLESFLCLSLAFDCIAFLCILIVSIKTAHCRSFPSIMPVIQRDGVLYFFVLFSSNLTWLLLLLYARPGMKSMHHQPAMILSSIMITRITLNLKEASAKHCLFSWSVDTFRPLEFGGDDDSGCSLDEF